MYSLHSLNWGKDGVSPTGVSPGVRMVYYRKMLKKKCQKVSQTETELLEVLLVSVGKP